MEVYVYVDTDNNVYEVFKTLKAAENFRDEQGPDVEDGHYEYVTIKKRTIREGRVVEWHTRWC